MPETYVPNPWVDGSSGGTPITAAWLNNIEQGIETLDDRVTVLEDTPVSVNTRTASYTLALSDAGKVVEMNSASATTVTVQPGSVVAFPVGTVLEVFRYGAGAVTLVAGSGVALIPPVGAPLTARVQYSSVTLRKRGTDEWVVGGDLG